MDVPAFVGAEYVFLVCSAVGDSTKPDSGESSSLEALNVFNSADSDLDFDGVVEELSPSDEGS